MYVALKPLSSKDNLEELKIRKVNWDVVVRGVPQQLVQVEGRPHGEGGEYGINEYYVYPLNQDISLNNLTPYWGCKGGVAWGFHFEYNNYFRSGNGFHKDDEIRQGSSCWITRNGEKFYEVMGRNHEFALAKAQVKLVELLEGPINVCERNWKEQLIGSKVWYRSQPGIITRVVEDQGCVIIEPDGIEYFVPDTIHDYLEDEYDRENWVSEYGTSLKTDYLDSNIRWYRK